MKIGIYIKDKSLLEDARMLKLLDCLKGARIEMYGIGERSDVQDHTDMVLSIGGDGTFLSASKRVANSGIPILGVNLGRLGFLSENTTESAFKALLDGQYTIESRDMLTASVEGMDWSEEEGFWPYALNEITIHRKDAAVMGIKVFIDGTALPTYWADGLIVATSSGSTAYSLSAGGPICMPEAKVLLVVPIAPHNLNVRPLVVPITSHITISPIIRGDSAIFTLDNRSCLIPATCTIHVALADFPMRRVKLANSNFVNALTGKLFWGEDIRNNKK